MPLILKVLRKKLPKKLDQKHASKMTLHVVSIHLSSGLVNSGLFSFHLLTLTLFTLSPLGRVIWNQF